MDELQVPALGKNVEHHWVLGGPSKLYNTLAERVSVASALPQFLVLVVIAMLYTLPFRKVAVMLSDTARTTMGACTPKLYTKLGACVSKCKQRLYRYACIEQKDPILYKPYHEAPLEYMRRNNIITDYNIESMDSFRFLVTQNMKWEKNWRLMQAQKAGIGRRGHAHTAVDRARQEVANATSALNRSMHGAATTVTQESRRRSQVATKIMGGATHNARQRLSQGVVRLSSRISHNGE